MPELFEFEAVIGCHVTAVAVTCGLLANEKAEMYGKSGARVRPENSKFRMIEKIEVDVPGLEASACRLCREPTAGEGVTVGLLRAVCGPRACYAATRVCVWGEGRSAIRIATWMWRPQAYLWPVERRDAQRKAGPDARLRL